MCGGCLLTALTAHLLVFILTNVGELSESMLVSSGNDFGCFGAAVGTGYLPAAILDTGCFFDDLAKLPVMGFGLLKFTFGTGTGVFCIASFFPLTKAVITSILNAGFAAVIGNLISGIALLAALGTDLVFLMGVIGFYFGFVVMAASGVAGTAAGIIRCAEIEVANLALSDHNTGSIIAGCAGIALNRIEVISFGVVNKAYMRKTLLEEKITFLGSIALTVLIGKTKAAGIGNACST